MSKYYLRVDAVNIANFVYDTYDISTIRGGSFIFLKSIDSLTSKYKGKLHRVATAASQGLFWFETPDSTGEKECQELIQVVLKYLHTSTNGHATFVAATQEDIPGNFSHVLENLEAKIHWQQWHVPTVALPKPESSIQECYIDGWRPGVIQHRVNPNAAAVISRATQFRRQEGVRFKYNLFYTLLQDKTFLGEISTSDLEELATNPSKGILNGKIAFIHIDGNAFGSIRRKLCSTDIDRTNFDKTIQTDFRELFLRELLIQAKNQSDFQTKTKKGEQALRLEVLLWGGDEMTLVVPAWKGFEVIKLFYFMAAHLQFKEEPLTHRAAIIFCHHDAPILLIRQLAEVLLARTKDDILLPALTSLPISSPVTQNNNPEGASTLDHINGDAMHYLVLESIDSLRGDLSGYLFNYYKGIDYQELLITAGELDEILSACHDIQTWAAHGQVLKIIKAVQDKNPDAVEKLTKQIIQLAPAEVRSGLNKAIQTLTRIGVGRWYIATDLWDYLPEQD